jgi:hypothetical protein
MTRAAEATGLGPMTLVAVEQRFPPGQRILVDELAGRMLPFGGRVLLAATALPWARDALVRVVDKAFPGLCTLSEPRPCDVRRDPLRCPSVRNARATLLPRLTF